LTAAREIFGTWDAPERKGAEGRLRVDEDGRITLELRRAIPEASLPLAVLHGHLGDGAPATLLDVDILRDDPGADHYVQEHLVATALLGLDLPDPGAPVLSRGEARIAGLEQVVGGSGLSLQTSDITRREAAFARIEWRQSTPLEVRSPGGTLVLVDHTRFEHDSWFRFVLEHRVLARYSAEGDAIGFERMQEIFDVLCAFVSFAYEARVGVDSLHVTGSTGGPGAECLIDYRPRHGPPLGETEAWLTLSALSDPAEALAGFYRFHAEQPSAYLILFEYLVFAAQLNAIDKLLYLARFLEVYHRTADPRERDPPEVQKERKALVREALGREHKAWGNQILRHSNEITFKERVVELLEGPAGAAKPILGATPTRFARLLGDCRNYWTHYSPEEKRKALFDGALDEFDDRVLLVVRACILDHIGVPTPEAQRCLEVDWRWKRRAGTPLEQPR